MNRDQLDRYTAERMAWMHAGKPVRSRERVEELYDAACGPCEHRQGDTCGLCGCIVTRFGRVMNKLAFATTRCPDNPPRFTEEPKEDWQKSSLATAVVQKAAGFVVSLIRPCCGKSPQ